MSQTTSPSQDVQDMVAQADSGARNPKGIPGRILWFVPLCWSLFQLWYASPLPFIFNFGVLNDTEARSIHLMFAVFLAFTAYPALKHSPRDHIPVVDWILALAGSFSAAYIYLFYTELAERSGAPTTLDIVVAVTGMVLLLEATRRALGPPLMVVAAVFLLYTFGGPHMPDVIAHKGASLNKAMSHLWLTTEGVFGVALGVSTSFVFLFVLFGAMLERAGAGAYFIKVAFSLLGHMRGGPAKAAVVASGLSGLVSGSSIANVVTTGTFTIPLMKRVGFPGTKAGAVEVAASTNGQLTPPIMGAAAFLMVEYVGISYFEVITHAFLPATISYIALLYIVHLEAVKRNMPVLSDRAASMAGTVFGMLAFFGGFALTCYGVQYPIRWIAGTLDFPAPVLGGLTLLAYIVLLFVSAGQPDLETDDPNAREIEVPRVSDIYKSGLYFTLPIIVLVYFLMIEQKSPGLSAFWATMLLVVILLTQKPLKALIRNRNNVQEAIGDGVRDLFDGLAGGARNMIGIALATATAGVIVGTVTLTGVGQVMANLVEFLSGGNLILMLLMVGLLSLVLGMGLPTTANYIVVSSLMAGVVVQLGAESGFVVPLIAVHLFVFYFGIMADVTPPVGLASFAAAAVSGGDAIRTGLVAFFYSLRTVALPFVFIFNTDLLLIDVTWFEGILVFVTATIGILAFTAGTMGWFMTRSRLYESAALLLVAFALLRPDFFVARIQPPFDTMAPSALAGQVEQAQPGDTLRAYVSGPDFESGEQRSVLLSLEIPEGAAAADRMSGYGLEAAMDDQGRMVIEEPLFGAAFSELLQDFDFYGGDPVHLTSLEVPAEQPSDLVVFLPALVLLGLIMLLQQRRANQERPEA